MAVGIDIGGTNTDAAVIKNSEITTLKLSNEAGITKMLEKVSSITDFDKERITVSTSLPLNLALSHFHEIPTLVLLIPGPGLNYTAYGKCIKGFVNHRGDVVEDVYDEEVKAILKSTKAENVVIAGKFSIRNPELELKVKSLVEEKFPENCIALAYHCLAINYPLRINTAIVNAKIKKSIAELEKIVGHYSKRFFFYKGDGGIIPMDFALQNPSLLYNSSPAAVAMGSVYLTGIKDAIVVDIGGTTTDFVIIEKGKPAIVEGINIAGMNTLIRCVDSFSVPFGGDSLIESFLKPKRVDKPIAFGGKYFTLTDALNCCGYEIGDHEASKRACPSKGVAEKAIEDYTAIISDAIHHYEREVSKIIVTGYLAKYLASKIEERTKIKCIVPEHSEAVNAVGVAVSKISLTLYARFDSAKNRAVFNGVVEDYNDRDDDDYLLEVAKNRVRDMAIKHGACEEDAKDVRVVYMHSYSVVRGGVTKGRIADIVVQIEPGICSDFK